MGVRFVWPRMKCLSIWSHNFMRHNEDVVYHIPYRIGENVSNTIVEAF